MMSTGLKALLFAAGGVTAAAGTAYLTGVLDPWLERKPPIVAALPETPAPPAAGEAPSPEAAVPQPEEPAAVEAAAAVAPGFDLLRVEPDGSVVIAGHAMPGAAVAALAGGTVLGEAQANADGEFVVLLDEPLAPGDYQIMLQATQPDGTVTPSVQTAVVSVPEKADEQVLALVEEPGEPSQFVIVPQAPDDEAEAAAAPEAEAGEEVAVAEAPAEAEIVVQEEPAAPEVDAAQAEPEIPAAPEIEAAQTEPEAPAAPEIEAEAAPAPAAEETPVEAEVAELPAQQEEAAPPPAATHAVVVEAVEIEGDTVFVAGHADPGRTVRVYADEILLGDALASEAGRFLVEAQRDLPVGNYIIRADLLADDGTVLARAAVPFEREPGVSIAAVAPETPAADEAQIDSAAAPEPAPQPEDVAAEPALPTPPPEDVAAAPAPQIAAAEEEAGQEEVAVLPEPAVPAEADEVEATAPKLERVDGAVIIRRGDNLWRISRRVYGKGIRYSSIYLANQDQIRNPDRIWPGQVFTLPSETAEGEPANLEAIADQIMVPQPGEGAVAQ